MLNETPISDFSAPAQDRSNVRSASEYSGLIAAAWNKGVDSIFATGDLLIEAKDALDRDQFAALKLPFKRNVSQRLMIVAAHPVLRAHAPSLPPSWMALYELTKIPDDVLLAKIADGTIHPGIERKDVRALRDKKPVANKTRTKTEVKSSLIAVYEAADKKERGDLFVHMTAQGLLADLPNSMRAKLTDRLAGQRARSANSSTNFAVRCSGLLNVALLNARNGHANEAVAALNSIIRKLQANGRDLNDAFIAIGAETKRKRKAA